MFRRKRVSWDSSALTRDVVEFGALLLAAAVTDFCVSALDHDAHSVTILAIAGGVLVIVGAAVRQWRTARRRIVLTRAMRNSPVPSSVAFQHFGDGRMWRIRTTVTDTPGRLAALCTGLAALDVNIVAIHVQPLDARPLPDAVVDELLVMAPGDLGEAQLAAAIASRGGIGTEVWPYQGEDLIDVPTPSWAADRAPVGP
jgi:hypothetical protein